MGISNFPFPSFTLLLTSDCVIIPGPSYVFKLAPLIDNNLNGDLIEEYPLANLDLENESTMNVALGHCDSDDVTETTTLSTVAGGGLAEEEVGVGIKFRFPFLKTRQTARFQLKKIFKRLCQFKLNVD